MSQGVVSSGSRPALGSSSSAPLWGRHSSASSTSRTSRLLHARSQGGLPPRRHLHGLGRAPLGKLVEARGARFTLLTGYVSLFLAFAWMLLLWSEGQPLLAGGSGLHAHRDWRGFCRHTGVPPSRGPSPCGAPRMASRHRRPAARPRRCDHAIDLRCAAHGGIRLRRLGNDCGICPTLNRSQPAFKSAHQVVLERCLYGERYPQYSTQIIQDGEVVISCPVPIGHTPLGSSRSSSARRSCSSCSPGGSRSCSCLPLITPRTSRPRHPGDYRAGSHKWRNKGSRRRRCDTIKSSSGRQNDARASASCA